MEGAEEREAKVQRETRRDDYQDENFLISATGAPWERTERKAKRVREHIPKEKKKMQL